ncbi:MAG: AAA family ATPase [Methylobacteriaceae bacterium]|nr:AAA family ATPase [Methylobacteriaceae bacterium]
MTAGGRWLYRDNMERPTLWIVAGPNGVGKTTYAFRHIRAVSGVARFVNLDEIARGLSPLDPGAEPQRAARVALDMTRELIAQRRTFTIETTLAGRTHLRTIAAARAAGHEAKLLYFAVANVDVCLARVARRVAEGGHAVPESDVRRRFARSMENLFVYVDGVDFWRVYDNALATPRTVAEGRRGCRAFLGATEGLPESLAARLGALPPCAEG